MSITQWVERS